ncbi:hypothetical protein LTSEURB_1481, partial [Salmonella enterica subsp. enterica serovar Urbana str. R8-2977]
MHQPDRGRNCPLPGIERRIDRQLIRRCGKR